MAELKARNQTVPTVVEQMLSILDMDGYRFLVGVARVSDGRPTLLVTEKNGCWYSFEEDVSDYKPTDARFLLELMFEHCPCTVAEVMSCVEQFAGKYRGRAVWITNAV